MMKDSGVEWIGEIPYDWNISKISYLYSLRNEKVGDVAYPPLSVTMNGIMPQLDNVAKSDAHDERKKILIGDFAINSRSDRRGSCGISKYNGSVSLINIVLSPRNNMIPSYFDWLFHSTTFSDEFYKHGHGIVDDLWTTNWQDMKRISVPCPPIKTQEVISQNLSKNCSQIEMIIVLEKKVIDILKEYRQSIITEAVTKGLHDVPMKDSGNEWIHKIPKTWISTKLGRIIITIKDGTHSSYDRINLGEFLLSAKNVYNDGLRITEDEESCISYADYSAIIQCGFPKKGDILLTCIGGSIGRVLEYTFDKTYAFQRSVIFIRPNMNKIIPRYLVYLLLSTFLQNQMQLYSAASAQPGIYSGDIKKYFVALPSDITEQQEIANYLDKKCAAIDKLIAKKEQIIAKLDEYKKSLIYECVTGKRDVPVQ